MTSFPFNSIEHLLNYKKILKPYNQSRFPLINYKKCKNIPEVIVCHDLQGGYHDDRFRFGSQTSEAYRFWNWWQIDAFIYFSHNFITIPPTGWVEAAHKNGCRILGTIITEFDDGEIICSKMLENDDTIDKIVKVLVEVSQYLDFDGWLLNIENKLNNNLLKKMCEFVCKLTSKMHTVNKESLVIWYDSVTVDGELKWQNKLNDKNKLFFDACDGIYLNYGWTDEHLRDSRLEADSRNFSVYAGIDVFGRGCIGGFETINSIDKILKNDLSVAIFGQSWTHECFSRSEFIANESKFWNIIEKCNLSRKLSFFPLKTYFCQGAGNFYKIDGQVVMTKPWYNIGLQEIQPLYTTGISVCLEDAFLGGSCIQISSHATCFIRLFDTRFDIRNSLQITVVYKFVSEPFDCNIMLISKEKELDYTFTFSLYDSIESIRENYLKDSNISYQFKEYIFKYGGWISRTFIFSGNIDLNITDIAINISEEKGGNLLLGYFEISLNAQDKKESVEFQIHKDENNFLHKSNVIYQNLSLQELTKTLSISWISRNEMLEFMWGETNPQIGNLKDKIPISSTEDTQNYLTRASCIIDADISMDTRYLFIKPDDEYVCLSRLVNRYHVYIRTNNGWEFVNFSPLPYFFLPWNPNDHNFMSLKLDVLN